MKGFCAGHRTPIGMKAPTFAHLILDVANVEKSLGFYRDTLGFSLRNLGELEGHRLASLTSNGFEILLLQQPADDRRLAADRGRGLVMNFVVPNVDETAAGLRSESIEVLRDVVPTPLGERTFLFADPDGYIILLSEQARTAH